MTRRQAPRPLLSRTLPVLAVGLLVAILGPSAIRLSQSSVAVASASASRPAASSSSTAADGPGLGVQPRRTPGDVHEVPSGRPPLVRSEPRRAVGEADGVLPAGTTAFDRKRPGITKLDPALLAAVRRAATAAAADGIELFVTSGWRSRAYQEELFRQAVATYGSTDEAAAWVASPGTSAHEAGRAVDLGAAEARAWLADHGAGYGLCQTYGNEPWHYELRPDAVDHGCPRMDLDAAHDRP